jgi:hypothetical protein
VKVGWGLWAAWAAAGVGLVALLVSGCTEPAADDDVRAGDLYSTDQAVRPDGSGAETGAGEERPGGGASASSGTSAGPAAGLPDVEALPPLPVNAFMRTADEWRVVDVATELAVRECVREQGFDYEMNPPPDREVSYQGLAWAVADFGLTDPAVVAREAFQADNPSMLTYTDTIEDEAAAAEMRAKRSTEENDAVAACQDRTPPWADGLGTMPSVSGGEKLAQDRQSWDDLMAAPRVVAALAQWSACMSEEGYTAKTPMGFRATMTLWRYPGGDTKPDEDSPPTQEEKAGAVASAACQRESGLWLAVYMTEVDAQKAMVERNRPAYEEQKDWLDREVAAAQEYIASMGE